MKQVNIHEAKTHLSRLVEAAARGESFVIARAGKPLVKVEAVAPDADLASRPSPFGFLSGLARPIPDDFDRMAEGEIAALFEDRAGS